MKKCLQLFYIIIFFLIAYSNLDPVFAQQNEIKESNNPNKITGQPFGTALGSFNGVIAYSNGIDTAGTYGTYGLEYQCVEYVNRYYATYLKLPNMKGNGNANLLFSNLPSKYNLTQFTNKISSTPPQVGDILCFSGGTDGKGHVAIVRALSSNQVTVIQQNVTEDYRDTSFAYSLSINDGKYSIDASRLGATYKCQGWLRAPYTPAAPSCTFNVTVKGSSTQLLSNGWKFWKDSKMVSDFYTVNLIISGLPAGNNWMLYLVDPTGNPKWEVIGNQSNTSYSFTFSPPTDASNGGGYTFRLYPQGDLNSMWSASNIFYCSTLPVLTISVSPTPLIIGQTANVTWSVSGGIPSLNDGGWINNIRLQWYQNSKQPSNALSNIISTTEANHNYSFQVPSSIPNTTLPGSNFMIAGVADAETSLPPNLVYAFTDTFNIVIGPTNIDQKMNNIPVKFGLEQNYPNPFNPTTVIKYELPKSGLVKINIYDALGREIKTLINKQEPAGNYEITFDAAKIPSGVYFYRLTAGNYTETKKMVLQK